MLATLTRRGVRIVTLSRAVPPPPRRRAWPEAVAVGGYLVLLFAMLIRSARVRVFWFDELFTLHLSRDVPNLLANLRAGADLNPPLLYWLTALSTAVLGETPVTVRLPGIYAVVLGSLAFYLYLRKYLPAGFAAAGMAFVALTPQIWNFFLEARPYGLMLGTGAGALLAWDRAGPSKRWAAAFAAFAVAGTLTHYFFGAVLVALFAAECARGGRRTWPGFALAALTLAALAPLWYGAGREYAPGFWAKPTFDRDGLVMAYRHLFPVEAGPAVVLCAAVAVALGHRRPNTPDAAAPGGPGVALVALAATPVLGCFVGSLAGGYYFRYSVPAVLGVAGLFAVAVARTAQVRPAAGWLAAGVCAFFGCIGCWNAGPVAYRGDARDLRDTVAWLEAHAPGGTVVCDDPFAFVRFWHSAPAAAFRPVFAADPALCVQHTGADTIDRGLESLNRVTPVPVAGFDVRPAGDVYFLGPKTSWRAGELAARGWAFAPVAERKTLRLWKLSRE